MQGLPWAADGKRSRQIRQCRLLLHRQHPPRVPLRVLLRPPSGGHDAVLFLGIRHVLIADAVCMDDCLMFRS
ncbi:hypothetical protein PVAP13_5KG155507 [Panicum virgatum]|uniref:Uncharacterized protein n=1 Tax=Panicum virgatum TaxID=38727 RepID=A0A8T0SDH1_PANVG|nr:hypothetical protein PVAP13_5KG155507 [Panicum virgatum]